jgi:hypothetical protein
MPFEFAPAYARAIRVPLHGENIPFIHPHDQITNKRAVGRPKDLADAADLVPLHGEPYPCVGNNARQGSK